MAELNGSPVSPEQLQPLALVNYGHFTSMLVNDQQVRGLSLHMQRLVRDCREMFDADLDPERVRAYIRSAVGGRDGSFIVRVTIFDPNLGLGNPAAEAEPHVLVTTREAGSWPPAPLRVQSATYVRDLPLVKHVGLLGQLRCRRTAQGNGFDDALFTDAEGTISEGATWNVAFYDGERVVWPQAEVLPGITMHLLQQVHEQTTTAPVTLDDLGHMQAAFAANVSVGIRPITAIDAHEFPGDHEIFRALRKEYEAVPPERL